MANTYDADLVHEILHDVAITTLGPVLANINNFTLDVQTMPMAPRSAVRVPLVTAGSAVLTNADDFETGDGTVGEVLVQANQKSVPFHATNQEMQKGYRVRNLLQKNMQVLGNAIQDIIFAPLTTANYGAAVLDLAGADLAKANLKTIWAAAQDFGRKNLILDGAQYAGLIPTSTEDFSLAMNGAYGFDSITHSSRFTGAGTDVVGFVADQDAIAIVAGTPYVSEGVSQELTGLEEVVLSNGITVQFYSWVSTKTRAEWRSLDVMIGAAVGDPGKIKLITDTGAV